MKSVLAAFVLLAALTAGASDEADGADDEYPKGPLPCDHELLARLYAEWKQQGTPGLPIQHGLILQVGPGSVENAEAGQILQVPSEVEAPVPGRVYVSFPLSLEPVLEEDDRGGSDWWRYYLPDDMLPTLIYHGCEGHFALPFEEDGVLYDFRQETYGCIEAALGSYCDDGEPHRL